MKFAWVENGVIRDLTRKPPAEVFHPDIAVLYDQVVPLAARVGDGWDGAVLTPSPDPTPIAPSPPEFRRLLTPLEFQFLFTSAERIAIKASTNVNLLSIQEILTDARVREIDLTKGYIIDYFDLLDTLGLITRPRKTKMLAGRFPRDT